MKAGRGSSGSGHILMQAKTMPLPLPHYSKKHAVNNLLGIILFNLLDT